ncbi:hybrid sensor histidine kinase/response regulator [Bacteroidia bacterium]|nr:hybrid sensor histidine kinase/response regulator [Bacteroidia bacterium]
MKIQKVNTKLIVTLGYCLLVILAITGFIAVYLEMLKSFKIPERPTFQQELIELNKTLTTMYQAEETVGLLSIANDDSLMLRYDSLVNTVFGQIDSMKSISEDSKMLANLDSLSVLVDKKHKNAIELLLLMNDIENSTVKEITQSTISAWGDVKNLSTALINKIRTTEDTVMAVYEKKGLFKRIRDAVKSPYPDSVIQINKQTVSEIDELIVPLLTDTLIEVIREVNHVTQKKNAEILWQMAIRQNELYQISELTGLRIQQIVDDIKNNEYQRNLEILNTKSVLQKQSTIHVAAICLAALIVAIFFMTWTLKSLNESQRLHKDIREAKKRVEKLLVSREQLIYSITHDIKTPVSSIMGFLDLLSDDKPSQKQQYYLDNINSSTSHILELVKNLLDFQLLEKNLSQSNKVPFSLFMLLNEIYKSFLPMARMKKIEFVLNQHFKEENRYLIDPYYIRKILNNLISNALKFTPDNGKVCVSASIENGNRLRVSVKDNGPGIKDEDKTRIFEEFTRLEETKLMGEGAGLGLTISKNLVQLLGGNIEIESQLGQGSDFIFSLPLTPAPDEALPVVIPVEEKVACTLPEENIRVLFVDDDIVHLNLFSELMKKHGMLFKCCSNSLEALDILQKEFFTIIFMDIQLPDINGDELACLIRKLPFYYAEKIPIIGFSAESQWRENNSRNIFTGFLPKPFKAGELLKIIEKYTGHKIQPIAEYNGRFGVHLDDLLEFVSGDKKLAINILNSFLKELKKDMEALTLAFNKNDWEKIKYLSHKMGSLMKIVYAHEIVSLLNDFEKGSQSEEKKLTLFRLLNEKIKETEDTCIILKR